MTWSIDAKGATREEALRKFADAVSANDHCHIKDDVKHSATHLSWRAPEGRPVTFASIGHFNTDGSGYASVSFSVQSHTTPN